MPLQPGQYGPCTVAQAYRYGQHGGCVAWYNHTLVTRIEKTRWWNVYNLVLVTGNTIPLASDYQIMAYRYETAPR